MRARSVGSVLLGAVLLCFAASCGNPFGSDEQDGRRFSPAVRNLRVSRSNVFCNVEFTITFSYDDPQDDIEHVELTFTGDTNGGIIQETLSWADERLDLTRPGVAVITYVIDCDDDNPEGTYTLAVRLTDERNHTSNTETVELDLL